MSDLLKVFDLLKNNSLSVSEQVRLQMRLGDLRAFLGSPGDWGYGTKLGELARLLQKLDHEIEAWVGDEEDEEKEGSA